PGVPSLRKVYSGSTFFDEWTFEAIPDPTNGMVNYVNRTQAQALGLVSTTNNVAQISIDRNSTLAAGAYRNSVRIISDATINVGTLILLDMAHVPYGCSVWGAAWAYGSPWPTGGEIDIYEGVNNRTFNTYTLHTSPGCTRDTSLPITGLTTGTQIQCDVAVNSNAGCGVIDRAASSYGAGFNAAKGGVIAVSIETSGISVWRWTRSAIPSDIATGAPKPTSWGTPIAQWGNSTCNTASYFKDLQMVFDITTCGDWAGNQYVWQSTADSGSCYPKYSTCGAAMQDPANFAEA
ncbi:concanavalin A-like lectin/glucanase domain-containing protein, partial [Leucosporidium creatinivorum]